MIYRTNKKNREMRERKQNRLAGYDYSKDNLYFVTSCTQDRVYHFGVIENGKMNLNKNGIIAQKQWFWLEKQYKYVILHQFVVMPNHIHGIIEINRNYVGTGRDLSLQHNRDTIKIKSLSELMGAYKTTASKQIRKLGNTDFSWQRSFHDYIIRTLNDYERISTYVINNPKKWNDDMFFIKQLEVTSQ